jgi:hypothetical protein
MTLVATTLIIAAIVFIIATSASTADSSSSYLPPEFIGSWFASSDAVSVTPVGPKYSGGWQLNISKASYGFYINDQLNAPTLRQSQQQFFVQEQEKILTYCGLLTNFYMPTNELQGSVRFKMDLEKASETSLRWKNAIGTWHMEFTDKTKTSFHLRVSIPGDDYVNHVSATFTKQGDAPPVLSSTAQKRLTSVLPPPCNQTWPPLAQSSKTRRHTSSGSRCPYGFGSDISKAPQHVQQKLAAQKKKPLSSSLQQKNKYDNCIRLNDYLNLKLKWKNDHTTNITSLSLSIKNPSDNAFKVQDVYIGLGLMLPWPCMFSSTIDGAPFDEKSANFILAYTDDKNGKGCLRDMMAPTSGDECVGAPVDTVPANAQQMKIEKIEISGGDTLTAEFTRPFHPPGKNVNLMNMTWSNKYYGPKWPSISFAVGTKPSGCDGSSMSNSYHFNNRGTHALNFALDFGGVADAMKCDP